MSQETAEEKLERYLRGKYPELTEEEIRQAAKQFSELALFLVQLSLKRRSQPPISDAENKGRQN